MSWAWIIVIGVELSLIALATPEVWRLIKKSDAEQEESKKLMQSERNNVINFNKEI